MEISLIITLLKEMGLFNLATIMCLVNSPSILFGITQNLKLKTQMRTEFFGEFTRIGEDFKSIRDDLKELSRSIDNLDKTIVRHDERLNTL
jgi:hypothetical protein